MKSARRDAGQLRELFDSEHDTTINPDVTLMSRVYRNLAKSEALARL
jgi:hypothetical protein